MSKKTLNLPPPTIQDEIMMEKKGQDYGQKVLWMSMVLDTVLLFVYSLAYITLTNVLSYTVPVERSKVVILVCAYVLTVAVRPPIFYRRNMSGDRMTKNVFFTVLWFAVVANVLINLADTTVFGIRRSLLYYTLFFFVLLVVRLTYRTMLKWWRSKGRHAHHVVLVGSTDSMLELYETLSQDAAFGYVVDGYFENEPVEGYPEKLPYLGTLQDVSTYVAEHGSEVEELYCGYSRRDKDVVNSLMHLCDKYVVRLCLVPNVGDSLRRSMVMSMYDNIPVFTVRQEPLRQMGNRIAKRVFDIVFSIMVLVALAPLFLVVSIIIKCTSRGPILFRQKRNGLDGREFYCLKFRSMKVNDDADTLQATKDDPRKYPFGDFMRRTSIDELPQFINVLFGSMSVVGPRPHMLKHTQEYSELIDKYMVRHFVKPGITGWAQTNGCRGETHELWQMEQRIEKDIWYLEHWSLWLDIFICYLTVKQVFLKGDAQAY